MLRATRSAAPKCCGHTKEHKAAAALDLQEHLEAGLEGHRTGAGDTGGAAGAWQRGLATLLQGDGTHWPWHSLSFQDST